MIWEMLDWISVFLFGMVLMLSFLDVPRSKHNIFIVVSLSICCFAVQILLVYFYGFETVSKAYPLIVHLPIYLTCIYCFKKKPSAVFFSLLTAYLLTTPRNFFGQLVALCFAGSLDALYIGKFLVTIPFLLLLLRFWSPASREFLHQRSQSLWIMSIPFALYYVLCYATTVYTNLLLESNLLFISFIMTLFAVILCALSSVIGIQNERYLSLKQHQELLELQSFETKKRLEEIHISQQETRTIRHDMRHYLQMIDTLASEDNTKGIRDYIREIQTGIDDTVVKQYCLNDQVNIVISSYTGKAKEQGIEFNATVNLPESMDAKKSLDLCILLSNALENAVTAAAKTKNPWVNLRSALVNQHIVIQVENSFLGTIKFENGIPKSSAPGHGFGSFSISTLAEKYGGTADFSCHDQVFTMRAVL